MNQKHMLDSPVSTQLSSQVGSDAQLLHQKHNLNTHCGSLYLLQLQPMLVESLESWPRCCTGVHGSCTGVARECTGVARELHGSFLFSETQQNLYRQICNNLAARSREEIVPVEWMVLWPLESSDWSKCHDPQSNTLNNFVLSFLRYHADFVTIVYVFQEGPT